MLQDKTFKIALLFSLIIHTTIFFKLPSVNLGQDKLGLKEAEIAYIQEEYIRSSLDDYNQSGSKIPPSNAPEKKLSVPLGVKRDKLFDLLKNIRLKKPEFAKTEIIAVKKKITLPPVANENISSPEYVNYYQTIRQKIKRAAYQNYARFINGEVYLSFVISSSGQLKDLRINEEKSTMHTYLKDIAKKTIYDAVPFPSFPEVLDYPELSFNVIISFEVD